MRNGYTHILGMNEKMINEEKDIDDLMIELRDSLDFYHWDKIQSHVIRRKLKDLLKFVKKERGWKK